jgi:hypothetical protein
MLERKKVKSEYVFIEINLNKSSLKDNYHLPKMDHILQKIGGYHIISMIDVFLGYN